MYVDKKLEFSDGQAITATAISNNVVDLIGASQDIGTGEPTYLVVQVDETFNNLDDLTITLESSAAEALTSATTHFSSGAIALANLTAGSQLVAVALPAGNYLRYLGARYTVGGATAPTAGQVSAFLTTDVQRWKAYPDALSA